VSGEGREAAPRISDTRDSGGVPLSCCIIARNEERGIRRCLESVSFADECVVVVDSRSSDATEEIARELGARVVGHPYQGNIEQKNFALTQVRGHWILCLDADEALTEPLANEIRSLLTAPPTDVDGYEINRVTYHLGRWIRHGDFYPDWQLRLFRRGTGEWSGVNPHGRIRLRGVVRRLSGECEHRSYRDLADQIDRIQDFSRIQARASQAEGRPVRIRDMILRPPARFLRAYLLKQGFRDGIPGLVIATATAFHVFLKYAKLWELEKVHPREDIARDAGKARRAS
jgi:glycosyltransferase involved in cell wall biosynthesis